MSLTSHLRLGIAALALTLTTSALAVTTPAHAYQAPADRPAQTAGADFGPVLTYWDVAVKYKDAVMRTGQYGNGEDVAFEIQNLGDAVPNIKLTATCNYRDWTPSSYVDPVTLPTTSMGMIKGAIPVPYLVSCPIKSHASVSSVFLRADLQTDGNTKNNMAYWDSISGGHSF